MYSESDLDGAIAAGVLSRQQADTFRDWVAAGRATPAVDEESFRLLTGFNDIFVSIAIVLLLVAVSWIGGSITAGLGGAAVAAVSWPLAEYFTRQRRMALPSIVLLVAFIGGIVAALGLLLITPMEAWLRETGTSEANRNAVTGGLAALTAAITAAAAWLHWRRFMVPITVAAGAVAIVAVVLSLILGMIPEAKDAIYALVFVGGLAMFAFAMRWDMSDPERRTRRSDVAFWLHLAAAPMMAHALFNLIGVIRGDIDVARALLVLALYVAFALVALAVDRRALLVSSLAYVLFALYALFEKVGTVELSGAFTALVIGSALLLLSAFWQRARAFVVARIGPIAGRLPPIPRPA
jgi:hypothetical protein